MKFDSLSLGEPLLRGLQAAGYREATPIQQLTIPPVLEGRDVVGCAQTGTGKTAAFAVPTLQRLLPPAPGPRRPIRSLILSPTRELAVQIGDSLRTYGKFTGLRHTVVYGGVRQGPQVQALRSGVDLLVATPGRLLDLIGQRYIQLNSVEILILDEADQMLDRGFIHNLRKIVALAPSQRQTLMFSATMPPAIRQLAGQWLRRPFEVQATPVASTPERVVQTVYFMDQRQKSAALTKFLTDTARARTLVFSRTKHGADKIAKRLQRDGIRALAIHGNKSQSQRQAVIRAFNSTSPPVLVATDLAARGLDFSGISHVVNFDLPDVPEIYVHRIGRTARAGASGEAVSFCGHDERQRLRSIERLTGQAIRVVKLPPLPAETKPVADTSGADDDRVKHSGAKQSGAKQSGAKHNGAKPSGTKHNGAKLDRGQQDRAVQERAGRGRRSYGRADHGSRGKRRSSWAS